MACAGEDASGWRSQRASIEASLAVGALEHAWREVERAERSRRAGSKADRGAEIDLRILRAEVLLKRLAHDTDSGVRERLGRLFVPLPRGEARAVPGSRPDDPGECTAQEIGLLRTWTHLNPPVSKHRLRIDLLHAELLLVRGADEEALCFLEQAVHDRAPVARAGRAHLLAGQAATLSGRVGPAELHLTRALACSESSRRMSRSAAIRLRAEAFFSLAALAARRGLLRTALGRLQAALDIELEHGMVAEAVSTRLSSGWVLLHMGLWREAGETLARAAGTAAALGLWRREVAARLALARTEAARGDHEAARRSNLLAVLLARRRGAAVPLVEALAALSLAHLHLRRHERARRAFSRAETLAGRIDPPAGLRALLAWTAAHHHLARGELELAESRARAATATARGAAGVAEPAAWAQGHRLLGEILLTQGRWEAAVQELSAARTAAGRQGEVGEQAIAEIALAKAILASRPEEHQRVDALRMRRQAIARLVAAGLPPGAIDAVCPAPVILRTRTALTVRRQRGSGARAHASSAEGPERWERFGIITRHAALHAELLHLEHVAPTQLPVLIHGETGSGKEMVAGALHQMSGRPGRFVVFNAATGQNDLFEAELFGHRRGAFTGAHRDRSGLLAQAEGGTLFLDEIADLQPPAQAALLRFLDTGEVRPVGSDEVHRVDTRIVAASLRSLRREVARGRFRQDLFFRLAGAEFQLQPLRARPEDILPLVAHFARRRGVVPEELDALLVDGLGTRLLTYGWPGNVRQLSHWVDQFAALMRSEVPREQMWAILERPLISRGGVDRLGEDAGPGGRGDASLPAREDLVRLLTLHRGNISAVARDLQTYRTHIYRLLRRLGIDARNPR